MDGMPRPRPPHLQREVTRHGKPTWYVRIGKGPRVRIRADFGTPEFDTEYQAAITGNPRPAKGAPAAGSLAWLIGRYRETTSWSGLSAATRRQRENIFVQAIETAGAQPASRITSATIVAGRERRSKTPHQARHFLDAMRGVFRWAREAKLVKADPTEGIKNPAQKKGPRLPHVDRRGHGQLRTPMAGRDPAACLAGRLGLHRIAPRRCCSAQSRSYPRRHRHPQN